MATPLSAQEALRRLLFALIEPPSSRSRTRILKRASVLETALREQSIPHPHDVIEVLSEFSFSRLLPSEPPRRIPVILADEQ